MKKLVKDMNRNFQRRQIYDQYIYKKKVLQLSSWICKSPYASENAIHQRE